MKSLRLAALFFCFLFSAVANAQVPNFSFQDIYGKQHQFSEYRGKWVIVNYWSTYCGPCLSEIPALKYIASRYRNNVVVLGMDAGETSDHEMRQFIRQRGINYTVVPTQDSTMFALGLIYGVPTTYIISPQGQIIDTHMGAISAQQLQQYINGQHGTAPQQPQRANNGGQPCEGNVC